jgi:hypothetical protein
MIRTVPAPGGTAHARSRQRNRLATTLFEPPAPGRDLTGSAAAGSRVVPLLRITGPAGRHGPDVGARTYGTRMIECTSCGTDAVVLDRSGADEAFPEDLAVLCAECTPGEITEALAATLLAESPGLRSEHARAA